MFQKIKKKFKKESILIYFDYEKSVIINADASERAMKAWLQINQEEQLEYAHCQLTQIEELLNKQIKKKTSQDRFTKKIIKKIKKHFKIKVVKKLLLFQKLIYMLLTTKKKMIEQHYDDALTEHFEIDKIMKLIFRNYYFSQMRQKMKKHIWQCEQCQKNKSKQHKSYEKL